MEARRPGSPAARRPGGQEARRPGGPEARRPGGQEARRPGGQEARRPGGQEARRPGGQEARGQCYKTFLPVIYRFTYKARVFVRLCWKSFPRTNTLAYYENP